MPSPPGVSVLMGMYNCAAYLRECMDSLLAQTFTDWELVACDDGSKDGTWELASEYAQSHPGRVTLLRNDTNQGLGFSLNRCLTVARGRYLARQDADDTSTPDRFEKQVRFLDQHPEYGWVSTAMTIFDETGERGVRACKESPTVADLVRSSPFCHAPTMFRAELLKSVGGYRVTPYTRRTEDYDLWMRLVAAGHRGINLQEPLYRVREDRQAYARKVFADRLDEARTRFHGYRHLGVPWWTYAYVLRPLAIGLIPVPLLRRLHNQRLGRRTAGTTR